MAANDGRLMCSCTSGPLMEVVVEVDGRLIAWESPASHLLHQRDSV